MNKSKLIVIALLVVALVAFALVSQKDTAPAEEAEKIVLSGDPIDETLAFYDSWVDAGAFSEASLNHEALSPAFKETLMAAKEAGTDPVFCQQAVTASLKTKTVSETDTLTKIMVLTKKEVLVPIAIVTLGDTDGAWKIQDISCQAGEQGPTIGEFNFEKEGRLLKDSLQAPFDNNFWYLIYERDGVAGYSAKLTLTESSVCTKADGSAGDCAGSDLYETVPVSVKGNMTEAGLEVVEIVIAE